MLIIYLKYQATIGVVLYLIIAILLGTILATQVSMLVGLLVGLAYILILALNGWTTYRLLEISHNNKDEVVLIAELVTDIRLLNVEIIRLSEHAHECECDE
jgi:hypothetical protein